ncbi:GTP pyrophosphokinase [Streptomyces sp. DZ1-3]|uniref:GTP pyrophosphokinase n=1 Tax=Streptomyces sp. DZ1-3 TaxID=3417466 RepID=UPI003CEDA354
MALRDAWMVVEGNVPEKDADYEEVAQALRNFAPALESLLRELLISKSIQFHYVRSRVKTKTSTVRKLANPTKSYTGVGDLTDMLGVRIVTYFPDDVDYVANLIRQEFAIDEDNSTDKRALLDPDRFGYLSLHFVASLGGGRAQFAEYARFSDLTFEIQIRSILQHAWAEIEHDLGYKSSSAVPVEIRRRFSRIAGLLEVADNEFQEIRNYLDGHQRSLQAASSRQWRDVAIDQDSVYAFMTTEPTARRLDQRISKAVGMQLVRSNRDYAANRQEELKGSEFETLAEVRGYIEQNVEAIVKFAGSWISDRKHGPLWPKGSSGGEGRESDAPELVEDGDDFNVLPRGVGLFYVHLYKCANGDVADPPYHERTVRELKEKYAEISTGQ